MSWSAYEAPTVFGKILEKYWQMAADVLRTYGSNREKRKADFDRSFFFFSAFYRDEYLSSCKILGR